MTRPHRLALVLLATALLTGCGVEPQDEPEPLPPVAPSITPSVISTPALRTE